MIEIAIDNVGVSKIGSLKLGVYEAWVRELYADELGLNQYGIGKNRTRYTRLGEIRFQEETALRFVASKSVWSAVASFQRLLDRSTEEKFAPVLVLLSREAPARVAGVAQP